MAETRPARAVCFDAEKNPNDLGKPVILSLLEGEASGTLVGYTYLANPTVDVQVGDRVFRYLDPNQVRLANGVHKIEG